MMKLLDKILEKSEERAHNTTVEFYLHKNFRYFDIKDTGQMDFKSF